MSKKFLSLALSTLFSLPLFGINGAFAMNERNDGTLLGGAQNLIGTQADDAQNLIGTQVPGEAQNLIGTQVPGEAQDLVGAVPGDGEIIKASFVRKALVWAKANPVKASFVMGATAGGIFGFFKFVQYLVLTGQIDLEDISEYETQEGISESENTQNVADQQ